MLKYSQPFNWKLSLGIGIIIYLLGASLALGLPEYFIPTDLWYIHYHPLYVPQWFPTQLLALWCFMTIPWLILAYRLKQKMPTWAIIAPIFLTVIAAIWVKPPHTHDLYLYIAYGHQLLLGIDPYTTTLLNSPHDNIITITQKSWFNLLSLYGPLTIALASLAEMISPHNDLITIGKVLKCFWILPYYLWAKMCWTYWRDHPNRSLLIIAIFANPVLIFLGFVEGHNDIAMVTFLCATGFLLLKDRPRAAGLSLSIAACLKMSAVMVLPVLACWTLRRNLKKGIGFIGYFLISYGLVHVLSGTAEWYNIISLVNQSNENFNSAGALPRLLIAGGMRYVDRIIYISDLAFYSIIATLCLLLLSGKMRQSPFLAMAITLASLALTRSVVRNWYYLWFWSLLWLEGKSTKYVMVSVGLWSCATLVSLLYYLARVDPYVMAILFAIDLCLFGLSNHQNKKRMQNLTS